MTCIAALGVSPAIDVLHRLLDEPVFYKNPSPWNLAGNGWIVRPIAFAAINVLASRAAASVAELGGTNRALRTEIVERQRAERGLEAALQAERELEGQLEHQAFHDPLTGLANRAMFKIRLDHALTMAEVGSRTTGLLFLDTDDFKAVNDRWGHSTGDEVLAELGRRISACCWAGETAARLGGDEFAVIIEEAASLEAVFAFAQRLLDAIEAPVSFSHGELFLRCSAGIAVADDANRATGVELLRQADIAMYTAKSSGKGRVEVFESSAGVGRVERIALAQDMQRAVARGEFVIHYQPCVALASGETMGFEALVRWNHPRLGLLSPDRFINVAEENGLIRQLGAWVLEGATKQIGVWQGLTGRPLFVAVNVSAMQLSTSTFVDEVRHAIEVAGVAPSCLTLEITESAVMADAEQSLLKLHELKALGVELAVDDFGTGYSSLNYLRRFPVDVLKIDKAFVDEIDEIATNNPMLIHTIVEIGRTLGLRVVAEGIERPEQLSALTALGCEQGQGYYLGRPVSAGAIEATLRPAAPSTDTHAA